MAKNNLFTALTLNVTIVDDYNEKMQFIADAALGPRHSITVGTNKSPIPYTVQVHISKTLFVRCALKEHIPTLIHQLKHVKWTDCKEHKQNQLNPGTSSTDAVCQAQTNPVVIPVAVVGVVVVAAAASVVGAIVYLWKRRKGLHDNPLNDTKRQDPPRGSMNQEMGNSPLLETTKNNQRGETTDSGTGNSPENTSRTNQDKRGFRNV
ncbi:uncharacterized protein LOC119951064 [Scyliorhinus canicula]|uniref:uncharacterized protein LOC119951064 n=1 Tax=Scyliorhinus canicula TaxID=7830 RepID=UPI0018F3E949|nr:uncharacterized protein LOC119951064 [Scyliorhinus canicula]